MKLLKNSLMSLTMPLVPKNHLSFAVGRLTRWRGPTPLTRWSVRRFAEFYKIDMDEAEHPIGYYKTIGELFTRKLRAGSRPIGQGIVHPVDAALTQAGPVQRGTLIQSKGKSYRLESFLRNRELTKRLEGGSFLTYYLCPTDYHRVHSPVDGQLTHAYHIPGKLWPVNGWSVSRVKDLFSVNERVVMVIETPKGLVVQVMIGATNVGLIELAFDPGLVTNRLRKGPIWKRVYEPPIEIERGQELGLFSMGSSVVTLYDKNFGSLSESLEVPSKVRLGESLKTSH